MVGRVHQRKEQPVNEQQDIPDFKTVDVSLLVSATTALDGFARLAQAVCHTHDPDGLEDLQKAIYHLTSALCEQSGDSPLYDLAHCISYKLGEKMRIRKEAEKGERAMYARFRRNPSQYIPGAKIIEKQVITTSKPDFFLNVYGEEAIAEFKCVPFKLRHTYQLQEYLKIYKVKHGFAVAPSLSCELPPNIHFIKMG
jgi:hypothetical protein